MPGEAFGLYTHQRNNRIRSVALIIGLFLMVYLTAWGLILIGYGYAGVPRGRSAMGLMSVVNQRFWSWLPFITLGTAAWVLIGFKVNVSLIEAVSGAQGITREQNPKLYRMLENLCISRGMVTPKLAIIENDALNAFASGVTDKQFTVTVTTGLIEQLNDAEMEAVLAHELTHIRNGDVKLMVIAVVIAGIISFVGEVLFRNFGRVRISSDGDKKGSVVAIVIGFAVIAVAWLLAVLIRLSLSRSREYLADAGAVELTKNPDAMISALLKISGRADIEGVPSGVMDMCFENDPDDFADLFSTHPSVTKRVQAMVQTAGGRLPQAPLGPPKMAERQPLPEIVETSASHGPWSRPAPPPAGG